MTFDVASVTPAELTTSAKTDTAEPVMPVPLSGMLNEVVANPPAFVTTIELDRLAPATV